MSGVDYLVERGVADPRRLGIEGFSNGAYAVNLLADPDRSILCCDFN